MGLYGVGEGGELGAGEVVAVHGDEGGDVVGTIVAGVQTVDYGGCEGCLTYIA